MLHFIEVLPRRNLKISFHNKGHQLENRYIIYEYISVVGRFVGY